MVKQLIIDAKINHKHVTAIKNLILAIFKAFENYEKELSDDLEK